MADLTICKYGCSSIDGCSGQCEQECEHGVHKDRLCSQCYEDAEIEDMAYNDEMQLTEEE